MSCPITQTILTLNGGVGRTNTQKTSPIDCNNSRRIPLVVHSGNALLKMVAPRLSNYYEAKGRLPEEQSGVCLARSTVDMQFVVRRLQELGQARNYPLCICFIDLCRKRMAPSTESRCGW